MFHDGWSLCLLVLCLQQCHHIWLSGFYSCFSWVGSVDWLSPMAVGYSSFFFPTLLFVFEAVGCHLKSAGAVQWLWIQQAGGEKTTCIMGDEEKALPCQITNGKAEGRSWNAAALLACFLNWWMEKKCVILKHNLTPMLFVFLFVCSCSSCPYSSCLTVVFGAKWGQLWLTLKVMTK